MAATFTLTGNLSQLTGQTGLLGYRTYLVTNLEPGDALIDSTTKKIQRDALRVDVDDMTGDFEMPDVIATNATDLNVAANTLRYQLVAQGPYSKWESGWFEVTADANVADLSRAAVPVDIDWRSDFRDEMEAIRDSTAAVAGAATADDLITVLDADPISDFRIQQDARQANAHADKSTQVTVETGRLSGTSLTNAHADKSAQVTVETGRLSETSLTNAHADKSAQVTVETGRLSETGLSATIEAEVTPVASKVTGLAHGLHLPNRMSGRKWRTKRAQVLAGLARGHIAVVGDSIAFGAATTGNSAPKNKSSWPGRLRAILESEGRWGGGWVICNYDVFNNPTWDTRWTFGPGVTAPAGTGTSGAFGFHRSATYLIPAAGYIEFTDVMDKVRIFTAQGSSGLYTVKVDGVTVGTVGNGSGIGTIAKVTDTDATAYASSQEVTVEIACGALASHTVRIEAPAASPTYVLGIKPTVSGLGKFEVSNASISGKSIFSLWSASTAHRDDVNGLYGLPMIDFLKADLLVFALGINDWQFPRTLAATQVDVATLLARQTTSGTASTGAVKANGDAMLLWNPQPDTTTLGLTSPDSWATWQAGWKASADAAGVPLLDLGNEWVNYTTGNNDGLFADGIHPNDTGSLDMVSAIQEAVMHGI